MSDTKKIYDFAIKWRNKFLDKNVDYLELIEYHMAEDCEVLGFDMDCGNSFINIYQNAFNDFELLKKIINEIDDINLLGSTIYSKWRYFNHWAYSGVEILQTKNREWFILVLGRLASLTFEI